MCARAQVCMCVCQGSGTGLPSCEGELSRGLSSTDLPLVFLARVCALHVCKSICFKGSVSPASKILLTGVCDAPFRWFHVTKKKPRDGISKNLKMQHYANVYDYQFGYI